MNELIKSIKTDWNNLKITVREALKQPEKRNMLIGLGVLCIIILLAVLNLASNNEKVKTNIVTLPQPTPTNQTSITFNPRQLSISLSSTTKQFTLPIYISTGGNHISAVQLKMTYDPKIFTQVGLVPGAFIPNGRLLLNKVDTQKGVINYAYGINPNGKPAQGEGIIATLNLALRNDIKTTSLPTVTVIGFINGTKVGDQSYSYTSLNQAYGDIITLTK